MMRIYKHYHLNVKDTATAATSLSFSSYPGWFSFLPRDATQSAVTPQYVVCTSVRLTLGLWESRLNTSRKSKDVIDQRMSLFGCPPVVAVVNKRKVKFLTEYVKSCNSLCMLFPCLAQNELDALL